MKHRSKLVSSGFIFDIIYSTSIDVDVDDDDDDDDVNVRRFYVEKRRYLLQLQQLLTIVTLESNLTSFNRQHLAS